MPVKLASNNLLLRFIAIKLKKKVLRFYFVQARKEEKRTTSKMIDDRYLDADADDGVETYIGARNRYFKSERRC